MHQRRFKIQGLKIAIFLVFMHQRPHLLKIIHDFQQMRTSKCR